MKTYNPKRPLISIHIPKCAGSSFSQILKEWYKERFLTHYHNEAENQPPEKHNLYSDQFIREFRPGICIHGHFNNRRGNGVRDYYPIVDQFITIMRDPFDLHLSNYFYVKKEALDGKAVWAGKHHPIIENGWTLKDYLREEKKSYIRQFLPADLTIENYHAILEKEFIYVGITENLQKSVNLLAQKLGFPPVKVPMKNVSRWDEPVPDGAREEFEKNNPLVIAIYRYIKNNWGNNQ